MNCVVSGEKLHVALLGTGEFHGGILQGTLLARLSSTVATIQMCLLFSLAPAITLAKTWDRRQKVVYLLVCAVTVSLFTHRVIKHQAQIRHLPSP